MQIKDVAKFIEYVANRNRTRPVSAWEVEYWRTRRLHARRRTVIKVSIIFDLNAYTDVVCIRGLIASPLNGGDIEVQLETHSSAA